MIFSDYPYHIPYGKYYISAEVESGIEYGDKVFISWKGSTPVVMNKVIDTEEVFEEDEEDNEYMVKIKDNEIEAILEKCVQKENKVYVSLEEILKAYDKVDNDNLSWQAKEIPYYSYGSAFNILRVERKVFGNSVGLDLVVPRRNENDYGELESISYNSLLGSKETVNIPVLWVDDEVYVLIDGFYKAMGELLIKPRVMGNMDRIPVYVNSNYIIKEKFESLKTESIYLENINGIEKTVLDDIIYSDLGIYVSLENLFEKLGGAYDNKKEKNTVTFTSDSKTLKLNTNIIENKIMDRNNEIILYRLDNNSAINSNIALMSSSEKQKVVSIDKNPTTQFLMFKYNGKFYYKIDYCGENLLNIINDYIVIRPFIEGKQRIEKEKCKWKIVKAIPFKNDVGSAVIISYNGKKAMFYAENYIYSKNTKIINSLIYEAIEFVKANDVQKMFYTKKLKDGSIIAYKAYLNYAFGVNEAELYHLPSDIFNSVETAQEIYKKYYTYDKSYENNHTKYFLGSAIYKNGDGYSYSSAVDYTQILKLSFIGGDKNKKIRSYIFPDKLSISIDKLSSVYKYPGIPLFYKNNKAVYNSLNLENKENLIGKMKWLKVYSKPSTTKLGRIVDIPEEAVKIKWATKENQTELNPYAPKNLIVKIGEFGEMYNENGRYWIAVGPKVMNPKHDNNKRVLPEEMKYGTNIDVIIKDKNNYYYYIYAAVGEVKNHTYPNGIYQTGLAFPDGKDYHPNNVDSSIIEFMGKANLEGLGNYEIVEIIVYDIDI